MEPEFRHEEGRMYAEDSQGRLLAEIMFPVEDGAAHFKHTFVDESLRGQGMAGRLVAEAVREVEARGLRARVTCPYVKRWLSEHPEHAARLAQPL